MKNKSEEIIVKFDQVTKQYGDLVVLDKLNLNIKKNEIRRKFKQGSRLGFVP